MIPVPEKPILYRQLPALVCAWYAENRRMLPWRATRDPYRIWVSEIMLQQTRVEAVRPYYERFLQELPDVEALAACPEDKLLKLWEGLGYYSRVRNLQKAAQILVQETTTPQVLVQEPGVNRILTQETTTLQVLVQEPGVNRILTQETTTPRILEHKTGAAEKGQKTESQPAGENGASAKERAALPRDPGQLLKLPGIGSYTAGAIASIAYGVRVPAVDGNVLRILARLTADDTDVLKPAVRREAEQLLKEALRECGTPGEFNQGMMDLGAGVCLPNAQPLCGNCPLAELCEAHRAGQENAYPVRKKAKERRVEQRTILIVRDGERVALTRRRNEGLLAGLYEFPNLSGRQNRESVLKAVAEQGLEPLRIQKLEQAKHLFSHVEWRMTGYEIRVSGFPAAMQSAGVARTREGTWFLAEINQIEREYPIPSAYRAYAEHLKMKLGNGRMKA